LVVTQNAILLLKLSWHIRMFIYSVREFKAIIHPLILYYNFIA